MMNVLQFSLQLKADPKKLVLIYFRGTIGRTGISFIYILETERERWKIFRKGLSKGEQEAFDRLFDRAKFHTTAGV
jgi:hypothetical protein